MSATRQKLIETAYDLFGRRGFHGIGLDRIIDEAGVSKQTLYNHFESKDDLVMAVLEHRHEVEQEVFARLMERFGGDDPAGKLYGLFDALDAWYNEPEWRGCIFVTAAAEFPCPNEPAHQAAARHLSATQENLQYLATLARAKDPRALAEHLVILMEGAIAYRHVTGSTQTTEIVKRMAKALLDEQLPQPDAASGKAPGTRNRSHTPAERGQRVAAG